MAVKCGSCRSTDVLAVGEDNVSCLACGVTGQVDLNPQPAPPAPKKAASSK